MPWTRHHHHHEHHHNNNFSIRITSFNNISIGESSSQRGRNGPAAAAAAAAEVGGAAAAATVPARSGTSAQTQNRLQYHNNRHQYQVQYCKIPEMWLLGGEEDLQA
eukprot:2702478-Rhodomonas_salina.1